MFGTHLCLKVKLKCKQEKIKHIITCFTKALLHVFKCIYTYILKRKSFATLTKMLVPFFGPKESLSDNAIYKSLYLPCIQHKNQNGVAYGYRAATIILRQPPILKSHGSIASHVMQKIFF